MSVTREKQPNESRLYDLSFAPLLGDGEVVNSVSSVAQFKWDEATEAYVTTTDLTLGTPSTDGTLAQVRISGGVDGDLFKITFLINTNLSNVLEGDGLLVIVDQ